MPPVYYNAVKTRFLNLFTNLLKILGNEYAIKSGFMTFYIDLMIKQDKQYMLFR